MLAFVSSGAYWLAESATTGVIPIAVDPGVAANGGSSVALTQMSASFTRPNGNAQLRAGIAVERVTVAQGLASGLKFNTAWLDPQDAGGVLHNPNAQIYFGFYYPIYTGACSGQNNSVSATLATITDNSTTFCAALDANAAGALVVNGKQLLSRTQLTGYLEPVVSDTTATTACTSNQSNTSWCLPAVGAAANTEVAYLGVTIQTPGGKPSGQQSNLTSLSFYIATGH